MKSILLSIRPEWIAKILNGEKTIEVRKKFPKDYQGWVYIYCTKNGKGLVFDKQGKALVNQKLFPYAKGTPEHNRLLNGKVVARFWCDKVEETFYQEAQYDEQLERILKDSCLTDDQLWEYADNDIFYAVHIRKLEIFDRPKELSEFNRPFPIKECRKCLHDLDCAFSKNERKMHHCRVLTKAPQNYCYVESEKE